MESAHQFMFVNNLPYLTDPTNQPTKHHPRGYRQSIDAAKGRRWASMRNDVVTFVFTLGSAVLVLYLRVPHGGWW